MLLRRNKLFGNKKNLSDRNICTERCIRWEDNHYINALPIFKYEHLFYSSTLLNVTSKGEGDIDQWLYYMCVLQQELFNVGFHHDEKYILELCKT